MRKPMMSNMLTMVACSEWIITTLLRRPRFSPNKNEEMMRAVTSVHYDDASERMPQEPRRQPWAEG